VYQRFHLRLASWEIESAETYSVTLQSRWSVTTGPATAQTDANEAVRTVPYAGDQAGRVVLEFCA
jgi:hypothetical protein